MKLLSQVVSIILILIITSCTPKVNKSLTTVETVEAMKYPTTLRDTSVVDDYHGTEVQDPYRWLEDDNSEETKAWVQAQNAVTFDYLGKIDQREALKQRLEELWNYERYGIPFKEGDYYYYFANDGLQNQSVLYRVSDINDTDGELVLDPNTFSEDGTSSLGGMSFDQSGQYLAYQVSTGGSDWKEIKVLDVISGELLTDEIFWVKFSGISWSGDGFYYSRYPEPSADGELSAKNEYHSLYYHKLGESQSMDELIYVDNEFPQRNVFARTSNDEKFLIVSTSESTSGNELYIKSLEEDGELFQAVEGFTADYSFIGNEGSKLFFVTNHNAPTQQLVEYDYDQVNSGRAIFRPIIPAGSDAMRSVNMIGGKLFANYLHNASTAIIAYDLDGNKLADVELPGIGSASISGKKADKTGFVSFSSYITPGSIYSIDTETYALKPFRSPSVDFKSEDYVTEQKWYTSKDGTRVPMFITHHKDLVPDGNTPTLLYGYGGFDIPLTPSFALTRLPVIEQGGIYAVANIRGGGEFGSEWHKAGTKERKQNVFDDFIAAAEYLIDEGYTNPDKLAIEGRSNGGLLVGACMTQRPDLYKVAFPGVGVLDMLRYHQFTIGWAWAGDYGRSDDPEAFDYLIEYSPLHNVEPVAYPSTMVVTADHDDRVVPAHSFKYISELQHQHTGANPVLIRIDVSAGHGAGMPTDMRIQQAADMLAFMFYEMGE